MFLDDDLLPISVLQHLLYCERQAALIHVERVWVENVLTFQGRRMHERVDAGRPTRRTGRPAVGRSVQVVSRTLGVWGKCDLVEFGAADGTPFPVEHKRGRPKRNDCDRVQLCAQAICLEEMTGKAVPAGAIFYGMTRRRLDVPFDATLRGSTLAAIAQLRELVDNARTPAAVYDAKKCGRCSLLGVCMPTSTEAGKRASRYVTRTVAGMLSGG